ncbi:MAG: type II secretion system protein [Nitrospirota bacterium]|nr:type II secretion system protein [Nitrospirota bacterium]
MRFPVDRGSRHSPLLGKADGFTLLEVIGVLAVMATLMAVIVPNFIRHLDDQARDTEAQELRAIAKGVDLYIRANFAFPASLANLSPDFVPIGSSQVASNDRGYQRYYVIHPDFAGFNNATGLSQTSLSDARFLLISDVSVDASPNITNATQFDAWWNTDETLTPDLKIYRGHVGNMFHLVSLSAVGDGGSFRIHGTATNSGGARLSSQGNYHLAGTAIEMDEADNFNPANFEVGFTLTYDVGYQFDPTCSAGSQWHVLGDSC